MHAMKVSQRQKKIIEALLRAHGDVSAGELAEAAGVSGRTVHRELPDIEALLASVGVALHKKAGAGLRLDAPPERLASLEHVIRHAESHDLSAVDRKTLLLCELLDAGEPAKLFALSHELQVTAPTVTHDLDEVEPWAAKRGLTLVRRRGYGVALEGSEAAKREAIVKLALDMLDESDLFGRPEPGEAPHPVNAKLLDMVGGATLFPLEQALWALQRNRADELSEAAYTRKLLQLSVAFARFRKGRRIGAPAEPPREAAAHLDTARALAERIGVEALPPDEAAHIAALLAEPADGAPSGGGLASFDGLRLQAAEALIRGVERRLDASLAGDRQLREGLLLHLEPALARIRAGGTIRNPLLPQIRKDYEALFAAVKAAASDAFPDLALPDEEIGFLAMHFGASLERAKQLPAAVRALLVCTSGIGSSNMLAVRIAKEFPQVDIIGHASWFEAAHRPSGDYDLIVSTVDLPIPPEQYLKLSPLLTAEETERLREALRDVASRKRNDAADKPDAAHDGAGALERLRSLRRYADGVLRLLERFDVHTLRTAGRGERELLTEACRLARAGEAAGDVADRLLERERQGSLLIPGTELALLHTRSDRLESPVLALFKLEPPIGAPLAQAPGPAANDGRISRFLLMLAPQRLARHELELLSEVSAMLLQPEFVDALTTDDAATILSYLAGQLEEYIHTNIDRSGA
ncbi:BglG family transcription antiterminator [Paenibacillus sp.]|uniref:BglG family transcription antiterminator n=1 Tax=Paenibacillus sp. TaxID=58172 RepID=UPI002D3D99B0|nr:BglG family transcription antiterminator [Paenibacillus sp.]HZG86451.1 BglG family transcription antiterminator [Paenibacillus sp.]